MNESNPSPAPVPPEDWECCGSDCGDACVWEIYYRDKAAYAAQQCALAQTTATDVAMEAHTGATPVDEVEP